MRAGVASELQAIFDGGTVAGLTDGQLLDRFAGRQVEEAERAFSALVARHGPMVLGVCQGMLGNAHDAEDAFQATFLVLACKAGALRQPELLGPWLHGVAHRTARRLKDKNARRRRHEAEAAMSGTMSVGHASRLESRQASHDEIEALHEEIERLPERYRTAIVLCDLQGLANEEAARRLGRPVGTISARLSRARERLRGQLVRRGLALPAGVTAMAVSTSRGSTVPAALASSTIQVAMTVSAGLSARAIPASIVALSRGVSRSMFFAKLRMISAIIGVLGAGAGSMAVLAQQGAQRTKPDVENAARLSQPAARPSTTDSLGDPLPPGARLRLGTLRFRPPSIVVDLALSPDETTIVTVGNELIAWDAATGKERWRDEGSQYGRNPPAAAYGQRTVAFSADGARFYTPGRILQNEVVVWETASGRHEVLTIAAPNRILGNMEGGTRSVNITPDGRKLAVGDGRGLVVCDLHGKVLYEIANAHGPHKFDNNDRLSFSGHYSLGRFSPDGTILAVVTSDRPEEVRLYEAETGRELRKVALAAHLVRLAFSPDGKQLATTERDNAVRLYDVANANRIWSHIVKLTNIYENYTSAVAFSPDGKTIAAGATDHRIYLMNPSTGEEIGQLSGHHWYPWTLAFTANSKMLYSSGWDPAIRRWDMATRKQLPLPAGTYASGVIAASPDGQTLAYEDDSGAIRLVNAEHGTERRTSALPGTEYSQLLFSPDGRSLAGGGTSGDQVHVAIWDVSGGNLLHRWDWPKGRDPHSEVESLSFTPDGTRLAAAVHRQSAAYIWDLTTGQQIARLAHGQVNGLSFSPDGQTLVTAGWDSIVRFWETETGTLRREIKVADRAKGGDHRVFAMCYAPAGGLIATAHLDGMVRIWQVDEMLIRKQFEVGRLDYGPMSFSPDGLWLARGARDGRVEVWDPLSAQRVWNVGRHQSWVYKVGFSRDARTLISGGEDGVCYLWDLRPPGGLPDKDPAHLWQDLAGGNGPAAFQAMWALSEMPDRAVALLAEKLRPVKSVIDLDHVDRGNSDEEIQRLRRMKTLLVQKDPKVESAVAVRRAISLLAQLGTADAIALLNDLARQDPKSDMGRFATDALGRLRIPTKP